MSKPISVLLADNHPLTRVGIRAILRAEGDLRLLGEATTSWQVQELCRTLCPDVLLLTLDIAGQIPIEELLADLRQYCPKVKVLLLATHSSQMCILSLIKRGVVGYLLKSETPEAIILAVRSAMSGGTWLSRAAVEKMIQPKGNGSYSLAPRDFTKRENQVLQLIVRGMSNKQIAKKLHVTERTAEFHVSNILRKLGFASRVEAAVWAKEQGMMAYDKPRRAAMAY
ncbi:MAG: LuxR C-terminal-related transcriptional regulator [Ardenticatenaceae bacterium]